ncbi:hypothetical protein M8J77_021511 [Diaphorina citri]|nr:hypothetical protein M8J77_021511 [Diaphorina citri]
MEELIFFIIVLGAIALVLVLVKTFFFLRDTPIFDIYHRPGIFFPVKYCILRVLFSFKDQTQPDIQTLDELQPFSNSRKAFDAVFFDGANQDGDYFIMGSERRPNGIVNGLFYLVTKEDGILVSEKLPKTELKLSDFDCVDYYGAEGIRIQPIQPMKRWSLKYEGKMRSQQDPRKIFDVSFDGVFQSATPAYFSYDTHFNRHAMAYSMAKEPWSLAYFRHLKTAHQNHYEQIGTVKATMEIRREGRQTFRKVTYQGFRDHSFGFQRDWSLMHRFTFQILFMKDGSSLVMGNVCQPCTCTELVIGYFYKANAYWSIRSSDFRLYQHGENGTPPLDYAFTVELDNGEELVVQVWIQNGGIHYVGNNREVKVHERFVKCKVNGAEGRGVSECVYNNAGLRRAIYY